jgi:hypothetical protein
LGVSELHRILDIELDGLRHRFQERASVPFDFALTDSAREFLLAEGTDVRYGARHLKRAIERGIVAPVSNLLASAQVRPGDVIRIDRDVKRGRLLFYRTPSHALGAAAMAAGADAAPAGPEERPAAAVASRSRISVVRRNAGK